MYDGWKIVVISFIISLVIAILVCTAFFFIFVPYWESRNATVEVPRVTGLSVEEAGLLLSSRELLVSVDRATDPSVPKGVVISQIPEAGYAMEKGEVVRLKVSSGVSATEVPPLVGVSLEEARRLLILKGLSVGSVEKEHSASAPEDQVISTDPEPGALVERDSPVNLVVSLGGELVAVPRLYGKDLQAARSILRSRGLKTGNVEYTVSEEHSFDIIISQSPRAGSEVPEGSEVDVTVNREAY
jgi:serine/threonine-protein kinase